MSTLFSKIISHSGNKHCDSAKYAEGSLKPPGSLAAKDLSRKGSLSALSSLSVLALVPLLGAAPIVNAAGLLVPTGGQLDALSIKQHHVDVMIEDGYAITTVDQTFSNSNDTPLEAVYSFPVPEKSSVGEFTYWINGKPVTGEVIEKERATKIYEQEKSQGREVAITEKDDYRTFDSRVYPVNPNSDVRIRLVYIQPVRIDLGVGRYVYPLEDGGVDEEKLAFWLYNDEVKESFSFNLSMRSSYPIDGFRLPEHPQASIIQNSSQEWEVNYGNAIRPTSLHTNDEPSEHADFNGAANSGADNGRAAKLDKDIVVYWRHQQGLPGSIDMVSYKPEGSDRGTFMMTVTPGDDLSAINTGRDWIFVLDLSGSMHGKYASLIEGVNKGLKKLDTSDRFKIVLFNNHARELTNGFVPVSQQSIDKYTRKLEQTQPDGGTNLYAGLEKGIRGLDSDRPSAVLLVTDGVANVGRTEKKSFLDLLETHDVRLFSFVMGNSANRPLLEGMTKVSNGFAMSISNSDDIVGRIVQTADKLNHEAYRDVDISFKGIKVKNLSPERLGTIYRGQQMILFGHYWGDGGAEVEIQGKVGNESRSYKSRFDFPVISERNPEIERLWAYATIENLQNQIDYLGGDKDAEQAIVDLAIDHGLVTNYTSMIVVNEEQFNQYGIERNNAQRISNEEAARAIRQASPVQSHRVDNQQPAFSGTRAYPASGNGSGAIGPWFIALIGSLLLLKAKQSNPRARNAARRTLVQGPAKTSVQRAAK